MMKDEVIMRVGRQKRIHFTLPRNSSMIKHSNENESRRDWKFVTFSHTFCLKPPARFNDTASNVLILIKLILRVMKTLIRDGREIQYLLNWERVQNLILDEISRILSSCGRFKGIIIYFMELGW